MRTFDFCLKFCHLTHFFASPLPPNLSTHRTEPTGVHFSLSTCLKLGVSESRLDGLDRHDLHSSGISFKLRFFSELSLKLRQIKVLDNRLERRSLE